MPLHPHLGEPKADNSNQDGSVQCLHSQHSPLWQQNVDNVLQTGAQNEQLSHALPLPHPQHSVE